MTTVRTPVPTPFSTLLVGARERRGLRLRDLSEALAQRGCPVDISYLSAVAHGRRGYLPPRYWPHLAAVLRVGAREWERAAVRSGYVPYDPRCLSDGAVTTICTWGRQWPGRERVVSRRATPGSCDPPVPCSATEGLSAVEGETSAVGADATP